MKKTQVHTQPFLKNPIFLVKTYPLEHNLVYTYPGTKILPWITRVYYPLHYHCRFVNAFLNKVKTKNHVVVLSQYLSLSTFNCANSKSQ